MQKKKRLAAFLLTASLSLAAAIPEPALKADFDGNTDGGTAAGKVTFVPGVQGQAVKIADATVTFPKVKGLTALEGTATVWIKPENWKWSKKNFINFLASDKSYLLYKFHLPLGLLMKYGQGKKFGQHFIYVNEKAEKLPDNRWLALGVTWSQKQHLLALYLNGEKIRSLKIPDSVRPDDPGEWILNSKPHNPSDRKNTTLFDMLRIYDKALSEKEMEELYAREKPSVETIDPALIRPIVFNLPRLKSRPRIDGNVDEREWEGAVKFGGFSSSAPAMLDIAYPGDAYAGWYDGKLYVCCVFHLMDPTRIVADKTRRDDPVCYDDSAEFVVRPANMKGNGFYQGIFNSRNVIFDQKSGDTSWNGNWEVKANVYEGMLNIEFAIPASELGTVFRPGETWRMNLARNRIVDRAVVFSTVYPFSHGRYFSLDGKMKIVEEDLFGRLTLDYARLFNRRLELGYQVVNRSGEVKKVDLTVEVVSPSGKTVEKKTFSAEIAAGSSHSFSYGNPLSGLKAALVRLTAAETGKSEPFYAQDLPLAFKDEFRISDETDLKNETLTVQVDCTSHRQTVNAAKVTGTLAGRRVEFTGLPQAKGVFSLAGLEPGDYTVELVFADKDGKEILRHKRPYNHIGRPEWLRKHPGTNAGVVWPFTPIKLADNTFEVWGRTHKFGRNLLPDSIVSQKTELFAAPPELRAVVDGKKYVVNNFRFTVAENRPDRAVMELEGSAGKVKFKGRVTMEFDGLIWYEFDMTGKGAVVEDLRLVIPLAPGIGEFYNAHYFARERSGGRLKAPMSLKRYPSLWAGNCDVGFSFMLESYKSWRNADVNRVFDFVPAGKGIEWTAKLIDRPVKLDRVFHYGFGIEANPVKPVPAWRRSWRIGPHKPQNIMHPWAFDRKNTKKYPGWGGFYTPVFKSTEVFRKLLRDFKAKGVAFSVYLNPGLVSTDSTEYKIFRKEWTNPYNCYPMCPKSTFTDFIVYCIDGLLKEDLKAVYVDSLGSVNCYNPLHGCGYIDEETGETALTWPILAMRDYMKRIYSLMHPYDGRDRREYFLWSHTSARNCAALNAFCDATSGGEEQENRAAVNPNYLELYPLDEFQAYYNHTLAGTAMMCSNLGRIGDKTVRLNHALNDQVFLLLLIHDVQTWPLYLDPAYAQRLYAMLDQWGYRDEQLKFHGFRTQKMITSPDKDIHVSVYTLPGRALAVVGNWQKTPRKTRVVIDKKALGLGEDLEITELRNGKTADPAVLELPGYNFLLLDIRRKQEMKK